MDIQEYYKNSNVRVRIKEFLGNVVSAKVSAKYLAVWDENSNTLSSVRPPDELDFFLEKGMGLSRSLWDTEAMIFHFDIEYVNFSFPAEAYLDPLKSFEFQEPAEKEIKKILKEYGIYPLHLLSGRGHHFIWQVKKDSPAYKRLAEIGCLPDYMESYYRNLNYPVSESLDSETGKAFNGAGLIMEYLARKVRDRSGRTSRLPMHLSAVNTGIGGKGSEIVSLDITEYGDPLSIRIIRAPFTVYRKHRYDTNVGNRYLTRYTPDMIVVPVQGIDTYRAVMIMRDMEKAAELASHTITDIPDWSEETFDLIDEYRKSALNGYHRYFYSIEHEPSQRWPRSYDNINLSKFSSGVRETLSRPNDLLLKPVRIRELVFEMLGSGWHPRHIAGLIRSKYERNYGWGDRWYKYSAPARADFYARIFAGEKLVKQPDRVVGYQLEKI